jgi:hypothetical protein
LWVGLLGWVLHLFRPNLWIAKLAKAEATHTGHEITEPTWHDNRLVRFGVSCAGTVLSHGFLRDRRWHWCSLTWANWTRRSGLWGVWRGRLLCNEIEARGSMVRGD